MKKHDEDIAGGEAIRSASIRALHGQKRPADNSDSDSNFADMSSHGAGTSTSLHNKKRRRLTTRHGTSSSTEMILGVLKEQAQKNKEHEKRMDKHLNKNRKQMAEMIGVMKKFLELEQTKAACLIESSE